MNLLRFRKKISDTGYTELISPNNSPLDLITLGLLRLQKEEKHTFISSKTEIALIVLTGVCKIYCSGVMSGESIGARPSVFEGPASAFYLPPNQELNVTAETHSEIAVVQVKAANKGLNPRLITPSDVGNKLVGKGCWRRFVSDIISGDFPAERFIIGETINPPGNWSSSPPHKHDRHNPPHESQFEEVYFYRFDPPQGYGLQRIYTAEGDIDECYAVQQNDVVAIPRGYHPVVAGPGYKLYYLWILAGRGREPKWYEDPKHSWIHDSIE